MGRSLFQLEDDLIDSLCFGFSDGDVREAWTDALEESRQALQESVRERMRATDHLEKYADETTVQLYGGDFVVVLPSDAEDEILGYEYGDGENRPLPVLRQGMQEASSLAAAALTRGLDLP